eukprot:1026964_1
MAAALETDTEIHDEHLKVPQITSIVTNNSVLLITFIFVKQAKQSIDNAKNSGHGGHAHKHGDEVVTIRKELQFHEIETQIQCKDDKHGSLNVSLGGFRRIELLQKCHSHSHNENHAQCESQDDPITLCYPATEINQYLMPHHLEWLHLEKTKNFLIRMRLRYKIAYRVAHLSQQIDSIISGFSQPYQPQNTVNEKKEEVNHDVVDASSVSLCSNKWIEIDTLSTRNKTRTYLQTHHGKNISTYPNEWLFYPSLCIGNISQRMLSSFDPIDDSSMLSSSDTNEHCSVLFCYDGFNKDHETLCSCFAVNLNDGMWYTLPAINNKRSRSQIVYAPNTKHLLLCGGYQYDMKNGTKYMNTMEYLDLSATENEKKPMQLEWRKALDMRASRCEHSVGLITYHNNGMNNRDLIMICGGSNDMFLRSTSVLSINDDGAKVSFSYKRGGLMKEACIKGSMSNNGDNVYIIGGNNGFGSTRNAQCFNLEKNRWSMIHDTLFEHDDYPCVWMEQDTNSQYYGMIGVMGHSQQLSCVEYYDTRNNKWTSHCQYPYFTSNDDQPGPLQITRMIHWARKS